MLQNARTRVDRIAALLLVLMLLAPAARAATVVGRVTIDPVGVSRADTPVAVHVTTELPEGVLALAPSGVGAGAGQPIPVQIERDTRGEATLRFILHRLDRVGPKTFDVIRLGDDPAAPREGFHFEDGEGYRDLRYGTAGVLRDMIAYDPARRSDTFKPYTHVFRFPASSGDPAAPTTSPADEFITKGPGGKYPHHRGIYLGWNKTQFGDFWHCPEGSQRHVKYLQAREFAGPVAARQAEVVEWVTKDETPVVRDTRELTVWRVSPTAYLLDYDITVEALTDEPVKLDGDAHHAGFHFRAAQEVADAKGPDGKAGAATFTKPAGAKLIKDDVYSGCDWTHMAFSVKGKPYAVTHMDAPTNPRPIEYSLRPYGRFGSFFKATVEKDQPLKLRYRLIVRDGGQRIAPDQLAAEYKDFATAVKGSFVAVR
jgi:hypothetical protein